MKINWLEIQTKEAVDEIITRSFSIPCLIFKHSTRCQLSSIAKYRLEDDWVFESEDLEPYFLDLLRFRFVSDYIAESFSVHHESPQVLLIYKGECFFDVSHLDISIRELKDALLMESIH